jgi:putative ABC transport system substrate-binding protein
MSLRRREFIAGLGGAAAAWPLAARAQQGERVRRVGVLMGGTENDPWLKSYLSAFTQALADLGPTDGRNLRMDRRYAGDDINRIRALAAELVSLQPDIIVTIGATATAAVQRETRPIPIVFANALVKSGVHVFALASGTAGERTPHHDAFLCGKGRAAMSLSHFT